MSNLEHEKLLAIEIEVTYAVMAAQEDSGITLKDDGLVDYDVQLVELICSSESPDRTLEFVKCLLANAYRDDESRAYSYDRLLWIAKVFNSVGLTNFAPYEEEAQKSLEFIQLVYYTAQFIEKVGILDDRPLGNKMTSVSIGKFLNKIIEWGVFSNVGPSFWLFFLETIRPRLESMGLDSQFKEIQKRFEIGIDAKQDRKVAYLGQFGQVIYK